MIQVIGGCVYVHFSNLAAVNPNMHAQSVCLHRLKASTSIKNYGFPIESCHIISIHL